MPVITTIFSMLILLWASTGAVYAQVTSPPPGQDPFGTTDTSGLFEGYNAENPASSLFNGDVMKDNGMFTTPLTQLGGATPYLEMIKPERTNEGGPSFIVLTSHYSPTGDLTSASTINLTVTVKNVGDYVVRDIVFHAKLEDPSYAALVADPAPEPAMTGDSAIDSELTWDTLADGAVFDLEPGASTDISWSFKPNKDDVILRWRLMADFGRGQSVLLQWIPIKNPNPQAGGGSGTTPGGGSFTNPCTSTGGTGAFPDDMTNSQVIPLFKQHWNIELVNNSANYTNEKYHGLLKAWWEALTTVECTPFLTEAFAGSPLQIVGIGGGGGGWWGEYMGGNVQHMWLDNISGGTVPHIKQNLIHELGHVWRGGQPSKYATYESTICGNGSVHAYVSGYGTTNCSENMAEIAGYYAIRESNEWGAGPPAYCPSKNPFDWNQAKYYEWAKTAVFGGKEYGPPPPTNGTC